MSHVSASPSEARGPIERSEIAYDEMASLRSAVPLAPLGETAFLKGLGR